MSDLSGDDLAASILADAGGAEAPPKKASMMPTIIAVVVLTLVAVGGGAGVGMLMGQPAEPEAEHVAEAKPAEGETAGAEAEAKEGEAKVPLVVLKLEPITTNLVSPPKTMVRLEASIVIQPDEVENAELLAAEVHGDTLTFLRTVELAQVEGSRGLLHLREDLRERAKLRSPAVSDYLIQSLVAQ